MLRRLHLKDSQQKNIKENIIKAPTMINISGFLDSLIPRSAPQTALYPKINGIFSVVIIMYTEICPKASAGQLKLPDLPVAKQHHTRTPKRNHKYECKQRTDRLLRLPLPARTYELGNIDLARRGKGSGDGHHKIRHLAAGGYANRPTHFPCNARRLPDQLSNRAAG